MAIQRRIRRLAARGFKGATFSIDADGFNVQVSGQNGAGKTTIADAYFWLLTGKLSNSKTANVWGLDDESTNPVVVELEFVDDSTFQRELVKRKDGGDTSKFYVNDVPCSETKFKQAVNALAPDDLFPVLSNPFFAPNMKWQELRNLLFQTFGDVTLADVIHSSDNLKLLATHLKSRSIQEFSALLKGKVKNLKADADKIPAVIAELQAQIERFGNIDKDDIQRRCAELEKEVTDKTAEIQKLKAERQSPDGINGIAELSRDVATQIKRYDAMISHAQSQLETLKNEWRNVKNETFGICPTCGQTMKSEAWTRWHDRKINEVVSEGKAKSSELKQLTVQRDQLKVRLDTLQDKLGDLMDNFKPSADLSTIHNLESELQTLTIAWKAAVQESANIERREQLVERVSSLKADEKKLQAEISKKEYLVKLTDKFQHKQAELVENKINSEFEVTQFKLFEHLKNGEIKPCCEPTLNGVVPYSQCSCGEKFMIAMDILKTLQAHYDVELPIFIDDAESYTSNSYIDVPNQIFKLTAVDNTALKIEVESQQLLNIDFVGYKKRMAS